MRDAGVLERYMGNPVNCIAESLVGISLPGTNVKLVEQTKQDEARKSSKAFYWPQGNNAMKIISDNKIGLEFRLVDGHFNYAMLSMAVNYEASDDKQYKQGELYKRVGTIAVTMNMGKRWQLVTYLKDCVYESCGSIELRYSNKADEAQFQIGIMFSDYEQKLLCDGVEIDPTTHYNRNKGN